VAARRGDGVAGLARGAVTLLLDLVVLKPIAIFVWWFSQRANTTHFPAHRELRRRIDRALAAGRPVVVACNHVSWFDDPVIPMALYDSGPRALGELAALAVLIAACWAAPPALLPPAAGGVIAACGGVAIGRLGVRKVWWTLGDLVNLSDASVLRGKLALTRRTPPGALMRAALSLADVAIPWFMRSGTTKTLFVDRRAGDDARRIRARALSQALDVAARPEPVWIFFEGGRSRVPGVLAPARRGVGALVLGLLERGHDPLVVVVVHRGMERLIPPGGSRFLSFGHRVEVRWSEFDLAGCAAVASGDAQAVADAVRAEALRLQPAEHAGGDSA